MATRVEYPVSWMPFFFYFSGKFAIMYSVEMREKKKYIKIKLIKYLASVNLFRNRRARTFIY